MPIDINRVLARKQRAGLSQANPLGDTFVLQVPTAFDGQDATDGGNVPSESLSKGLLDEGTEAISAPSTPTESPPEQISAPHSAPNQGSPTHVDRGAESKSPEPSARNHRELDWGTESQPNEGTEAISAPSTPTESPPEQISAPHSAPNQGSLTHVDRGAKTQTAKRFSRRGRPKLKPNTLTYQVLHVIGRATAPLRSQDIAVQLGTTKETVKVTIKRLRRDGFVATTNLNRCGARFHLTRIGTAIVNEIPVDRGTKKDIHKGTKSPLSSFRSSKIIDPTITISRLEAHKTIAAELDVLTHKLGFEDKLQIGARDLLSIWQEGTFGSDVKAFYTSIEHLAFYMSTPDGQKLNKNPKGFIMSELRKGYCGRPAGFKSWEEQQAELKIKEARDRLERLRELEKEQFSVDFEIWVTDLDPQERIMILRRAKVHDPGGMLAKVALRNRFVEVTGRRNPFEEPETTSSEVA